MKKFSLLAALIISVVLIKPISAQHDHMHQGHMDHKMKMDQPTEQHKSDVVREGIIDLSKIDKNKDGKVYQDQMDWNVISDEAGNCPLCKMELVQVDLKKAKENLLKHDFKVK